MSDRTFKIPRYLDSKVIESLVEVANEVSMNDAAIYYRIADSVEPVKVPIASVSEDKALHEICQFNSSIIQNAILCIASTTAGVVTVQRVPDAISDNLTVHIQNVCTSVSKARLAEFIGRVTSKFKQLSIGDGFSGFPEKEIDRFFQAREATMSRLEETAATFLKCAADHTAELDRKYLQRTADLDRATAEVRERLVAQNAETESNLKNREIQVTNKEAEFDIRKSTYLRRELHKNFLKVVTDRQTKFDLTPGTQKRRLPVIVFGVALMAFFGLMTALSYSQAKEVLTAASVPGTTLTGWHILLFIGKQALFALGFIGVAGFMIRWSDRWFREHADAELMAKQFELDINRASWIVELALEWKDEKSQQIPDDLLEKLSRNLFLHRDEKESHSNSSEEIAKLLFGASSRVSIKTPAVDAELDRKGIASVMKENKQSKA